MSQKLLHRSLAARLFAGMTVSVTLALCGCQTPGPADVSTTLADSRADANRPVDARSELESSHQRFKTNPKDAEAALQYARALRATGQYAQAVAVLEKASMADPNNRALLAGYGRALADNGNFQQAFDVLGRAHSPDDPDWRILSAQGAALDQLERHDEARQYYASALKIVPDEPSVLSNLGLSYVLSRELPLAEETLRKARSHAPGDQRIKANLALAVGLQGRTSEAESIVRADLPPDEAAANVAALKRVLARNSGSQGRSGKIPVASAGAD